MSQSKSTLLRIPLEVRQDIYSYILPRQIHVWLRDDRLHVSRCLDPDLDKRSSNFPHETDAKPYDGSERAPASVWDLKRNYSEVEWARRARSAWGPHWMCEEWVQLRTTLGPVLLLVCKMMHDEIMDLWSRTIIVNVADLDTLLFLTAQGFAPSHPILRNGIKRLSITLRLPFQFFQSIEETSGRDNVGETSPTVQSWRQICAAPFLQNLTTLHLWFDHTATRTWSLVNERSLLDALLSSLPHTVRVVVMLPKLHPLHEHPDRHFLNPRISTTASLYRKLRQRWRYNDTSDHFDHFPDFPYYFDVWEMWDVPQREEYEREMWDVPQLEEYERKRWFAGKDMERFAEMERNPYCTLGNI
ncbi:hypothetical protein HBI11_232920 [Parastagonospora nodorum]|nr:hypothetical protein HBI11_232920 [Parastagonospora nodorum]KAH5341117.1 hypothetical protein HBI33_239280 [Parastagonospora nodorum]KAH5707207.1 hypothetical protein HBI20_208480 [Parastagonospora nodorum]